MATLSNSSDSARTPKDEPPKVPSFEQTMTRLEEIVRLLEDGKAGLDDALGRYEEGVGLLRQAYDTLEKAERKITLLTGIDSDGNPILRPIEDTASFSLAENANPAAAGGGKAAPRRGRRTTEQG